MGRTLLFILLLFGSSLSLVVRLPLTLAARPQVAAAICMQAPYGRPGPSKEISRQKRAGLRVRTRQVLSTLTRVALPTILATVLGLFYYDNLSLLIRSVLDGRTLRVLMADEAQFIQNFLTVIGLLFSILAGNAYQALYAQQEQIYFALFQEVSEAKSLLEQTTLVGQGRPFYRSALACIRDYVKNDLRRLDIPPAKLLSTRPMEDPLESIMYAGYLPTASSPCSTPLLHHRLDRLLLHHHPHRPRRHLPHHRRAPPAARYMTSVGVPSVVYETVKNLRQARGHRLGAMQRKFPSLGIALLYVLAVGEPVEDAPSAPSEDGAPPAWLPRRRLL